MKGAQGGSKGKESRCDQLCQPCAKNKMNSTTLSPGRRGALSSGHSLPTLCAFQGHHCGPSCNWVCVPTEFQANLGKHVKTWYDNAGRGVEEREKECAWPCKSCRALHSTLDPPCLLCGSLGAAQRVCAGTSIPLGVLTNATLWAFYALERSVYCLWLTKESQLLSWGSMTQALCGAH